MESCEQCGAPMPVEASFCESCGHVTGLTGFGPSQEPKQPVHLDPDPAWQKPLDHGLPVDPAAPPADTSYQAPGDAFARAPSAAPDVYRAPGEAFGQPPPAPGLPVFARPELRARQHKIITGYSIAIGATGLLILISTFLPWISFFNFFRLSGWYTMVHSIGAESNNFLFATGEGVLFFTGFWALLIGSIIIGGAVMLYLRMEAGLKISLVAGVVADLLMLVNTITLTMNGGKSGIGAWLFLFSGTAAVLLSAAAIRRIRW